MNKTKGLLVYLGYANQEALCSPEVYFDPQLLYLFVPNVWAFPQEKYPQVL